MPRKTLPLRKVLLALTIATIACLFAPSKSEAGCFKKKSCYTPCYTYCYTPSYTYCYTPCYTTYYCCYKTCYR